MAAKKPARKRVAAVKPQVNRQPLVANTGQTEDPVEATEPGETGQQAEGLSAYSPKHPTLENAGLDQHEAESKRQAELQAERDAHNTRTGDASR